MGDLAQQIFNENKDLGAAVTQAERDRAGQLQSQLDAIKTQLAEARARGRPMPGPTIGVHIAAIAWFVIVTVGIMLSEIGAPGSIQYAAQLWACLVILGLLAYAACWAIAWIVERRG